jgi:hypothetical protein
VSIYFPSIWLELPQQNCIQGVGVIGVLISE